MALPYFILWSGRPLDTPTGLLYTTLMEKFSWKTFTRLEKRHNPGEEPYEVLFIEGNTGLEGGFARIWDIVMGATANVYDNSNAKLVVGNGTQAADATQTALQGDATFAMSMDGTYPHDGGTAGRIYFKGVAGDSDANFAWEEWGVCRGSGEAFLNRKVESLGTKASGEWTLEVYLELGN